MDWWEGIAYRHRICGGIIAVLKLRLGALGDQLEQGKHDLRLN